MRLPCEVPAGARREKEFVYLPQEQRKTRIVSEEELQIQRGYAEKAARLLAERFGEYETPLALIHTFGCQQNVSDGERIRGMLSEMGYGFTEDPERASLILYNTCAVREHAEAKVFGNVGALKKLKKSNPNLVIALCGCMVQQERVAEKFRRSYPYVDLLFGTHVIHRLPQMLYEVLSTHKRVFCRPEEPGNIAEGVPVKREGGMKAFLPVMYGCNNFCTYCIVPYVRGRERSRQPEDILAECRALIEGGTKEITLLGQNVNSYGKDLSCGMDFADLLAAIAQIPGDFLIRFMTSHPRDASEKLFDTMARYPKIAKQLHLPFQSGSSRVLKAMNRHYDRETYLQKVNYAKKVMPDLVLTSDVIVGFPGETDEEFEETISLIQSVHYDSLFTFIFSPRPGTPAAKMDDPTPKEEKNRRFDRLCAVQNAISEEIHNSYIGKTLRCLVDGNDKDLLTARTEGGRLVRFPGCDDMVGTYQDITITAATTWSLSGKAADIC